MVARKFWMSGHFHASWSSERVLSARAAVAVVERFTNARWECADRRHDCCGALSSMRAPPIAAPSPNDYRDCAPQAVIWLGRYRWRGDEAKAGGRRRNADDRPAGDGASSNEESFDRRPSRRGRRKSHSVGSSQWRAQLLDFVAFSRVVTVFACVSAGAARSADDPE